MILDTYNGTLVPHSRPFTLWILPQSQAATVFPMDRRYHTLAMGPKSPMIRDGERLDSATSRFGTKVQTYDDGYGPLFAHRNCFGLVAIIRALNEQDAWEIAQDEFTTEATETVEQLEEMFATEYVSGRELYLRSHSWEQWGNLSESERAVEYARHAYLPFEGHFTEHPAFADSFGQRPNGPNTRDTLCHGFYSLDSSGEDAQKMTIRDVLAWELSFSVTIEQ